MRSLFCLLSCRVTYSTVRVCAGMAYGEAALLINLAMTLHAFEILPPLDKLGNVITEEPKVVGSFTACVLLVQSFRCDASSTDTHVSVSSLFRIPEECRCRVKPRFARIESLIRDDSE